MTMNHAVSELVCLLKNGQLARKNKVVLSFSKMKQSILEILKKEGYIKDFEIVKGESFDTLEIELAYYNTKDIPVVYNGLGMVILSTPKGILCDYDAKSANVGGELLLKIF